LIATEPLSTVVGSSSLRIWGHSPAQIHDLFWSTRGLQVVRPLDVGSYPGRPEAFLLIDPHLLLLFDLRKAVNGLYWAGVDLLTIRVHSVAGNVSAREAQSEPNGPGVAPSLARVGLTARPELARAWAQSNDPTEAWRELRRETPQARRMVMSLTGVICDDRSQQQSARLVGRIAGGCRDLNSRIEKEKERS